MSQSPHFRSSSQGLQPIPSPQDEKSKRRSSKPIREEHIDKGAFLIQFASLSQPVNMFRREVAPELQPASLLSGKQLQSAVDSYRTMERKGFRVTKDTGCLIPHQQYSTYQKGSTLKGHQRTFQFFARWLPKQSAARRNEYGWPMGLQVSHLCHRRCCARPDHLIAEEQWRNQKRNYCGGGGACDCGNEIKCLRRYQMDDQVEEPVLCTTKEEVHSALVGAPSFVVHSSGVFANRDKKALQRKQRKDKRARNVSKHEHETSRKQLRLGTADEEKEEEESDDDEVEDDEEQP